MKSSRSRFARPWLAVLVASGALGWWSQDALASLVAPTLGTAAATPTVEGRVTRLDPRIDSHGYPVTDVTLDTGARFTILGGYKDGLRWVVDEEASFTLGDQVRVRLERGPDGMRPWAGKEGVQHAAFEMPPGSALSAIAPVP